MKGRIEGNDIIISKDYFEHMLNCLANQKFLPLPEDQFGIEKENQIFIEECWRDGMEVLYGKYGIPGHVYVLSPQEYHSLNTEGCWPLKFTESDLKRFDDENDAKPRPSFKQALSTLINQYSKENGSDTPDFILAKFLTDSLKAFNKATNRREEWYEDDKLPECKSFGPWNISVEEQLCEKLSEDIISQMNQVKMKDNKYHSGTVTTSSYPYNVEFIISYEPK